MLEAVIAMPLFILLIGSMAWIGDLIYAKQRLVLADRYAAWSIGNRYRAGDTDGLAQEIQGNFFPEDSSKTPRINVPAGSPPRWSYEAYAGVDLDGTMPVWIQGWLAVGDVAYGSDVSTAPFSQMHGRDISPGPSGYEGHAVVMRSSVNGTREEEFDATDSLSVYYVDIRDEQWADVYVQ